MAYGKALGDSAALREIGSIARQEMGRWFNNRLGNSQLPLRRRLQAMSRLPRMKTLQKFSSIHASVHNQSCRERALVNRKISKERHSLALAEWRAVMG